ncbi:MAG: non-heme iron oxygenase ferredoxin subunit [Gammaproteobacteria bacterium]|nr:non-heme iron oxygenase ferredoxin subunit [Gammaproteobacteria bacterium]
MQVTIALAADFPPDTMRRHEVPGRAPLAVYHLEDGFFATEDHCSHMGASLSAGHIEAGAYVVCPWHAGAFEIRTGVAAAPPCRRAIPVFATRLEAGMVVVDLPD